MRKHIKARLILRIKFLASKYIDYGDISICNFTFSPECVLQEPALLFCSKYVPITYLYPVDSRL